MPSSFLAKKQRILQQLSVADEEYTDLSPKGSIDEGIRTLIDELNGIKGLVTTSSCAGRISVFLEGPKKGTSASATTEAQGSSPCSKPLAGPGGKGGGSWLFISHQAVQPPHSTSSTYLHSLFGLHASQAGCEPIHAPGRRFVHLKFEAMILHLACASLVDAQRVLSAALAAGFRESGAVSLTSTISGEETPTVAVRSTGLAFDSIIGYETAEGNVVSIVDEMYLETLIAVANERFCVNTERIQRFRSAILKLYQESPKLSKVPPDRQAANAGWENAEARKQRKREEGLQRQKLLQAERRLSLDTSAPGGNATVALSDVFS